MSGYELLHKPCAITHEEVKAYLHPWCKELRYWEAVALARYVQECGIPTKALNTEGLKEAARLLYNRPSLGHEEVHYFAQQVQEERAAKHGARMVHMQIEEGM